MFDEAISARWKAETAWSLAASSLLHLLAALAAALWWIAPPPPVVGPDIPVTLLTPAEFEALLHPPAPEPAPKPVPPPQPIPVRPDAGALTHAATILSGGALALPMNRKALADLPKLNPTERMVQLCNIEALEQVARARHDFAPERVIAYAEKDLAYGRDAIVADGAAVRSGDDWYALRYRCRLSPGHDAVVAFDFRAGDRLTPERVVELGLPVGQ